MPLRLAFDLDGVFADMDSALANVAEQLFGDRAVARPPSDLLPESIVNATRVKKTAAEVAFEQLAPLPELRLGARERQRLWQRVTETENFWETLSEIEAGAVTRLARLASDLRWETIFLTSRPETAGANSQVQSQRWLAAHGFPLASVFVVSTGRGRVAAALDLNIVVDDTPSSCLDVVADSRAGAVLVWRRDEALIPPAARQLGIGIVRSLEECFDVLKEIDVADKAPGLVDRIRKLFRSGDSLAGSSGT